MKKEPIFEPIQWFWFTIIFILSVSFSAWLGSKTYNNIMEGRASRARERHFDVEAQLMREQLWREQNAVK